MAKPLERALLGTDAGGIPIILATDSLQIAFDVREISSSAADLGLASTKEVAKSGLYLWEGYSSVEVYNGWEGSEPEVVYCGKLRPVLPEEVATLYALKPPEEEICP